MVRAVGGRRAPSLPKPAPGQALLASLRGASSHTLPGQGKWGLGVGEGELCAPSLGLKEGEGASCRLLTAAEAGAGGGPAGQ